MKRPLLFLSALSVSLSALLLSAAAQGTAEKRDLKFSVCNEKGKRIKSPQLYAFLKSDGLAVLPDDSGTLNFRVTDADTLSVVAGNNVYEFPVAGFDSLCLTMTKGRELAGMEGGDTKLDVGYGTVSAKDNTASTGHLDMKGVEGYVDLKSYMEGRVAGVYFQGNELIIRGSKSFHGRNEALIVVDGTEYGSFSAVNGMLNPRDIESVTILKDSSSSIYGSRGANGVVIITTKAGK